MQWRGKGVTQTLASTLNSNSDQLAVPQQQKLQIHHVHSYWSSVQLSVGILKLFLIQIWLCFPESTGMQLLSAQSVDRLKYDSMLIMLVANFDAFLSTLEIYTNVYFHIDSSNTVVIAKEHV